MSTKTSARLAILTRSVNGKFIHWRKGMRVKASFFKGVGWSVERVTWRRPRLPLFNSLCGVPRSAFKFL